GFLARECVCHHLDRLSCDASGAALVDFGGATGSAKLVRVCRQSCSCCIGFHHAAYDLAGGAQPCQCASACPALGLDSSGFAGGTAITFAQRLCVPLERPVSVGARLGFATFFIAGRGLGLVCPGYRPGQCGGAAYTQSGVAV